MRIRGQTVKINGADCVTNAEAYEKLMGVLLGVSATKGNDDEEESNKTGEEEKRNLHDNLSYEISEHSQEPDHTYIQCLRLESDTEKYQGCRSTRKAHQ